MIRLAGVMATVDIATTAATATTTPTTPAGMTTTATTTTTTTTTAKTATTATTATTTTTAQPVAPEPPASLDPSTVTPGALGFTVTLILGIATYLLIRSMNRHLRKIPRDPR